MVSDFCRHCGASIPPRFGEGTCRKCDPCIKGGMWHNTCRYNNRLGCACGYHKPNLNMGSIITGVDLKNSPYKPASVNADLYPELFKKQIKDNF